MSFIETMLDGKTDKERKSKAICAVAIVITAILLVIAIIAFTICQIVVTVGGDEPIDYKIERTEKKELAPSAVKLGTMLTLDEDHPYEGGDEDYFVSLQKRNDRPKIEDGSANAYTVLAQTLNYVTTEATATALNKMLTAFYNTVKDDNLIIFNTYNVANSSQDAIFSAGTVIEFKYWDINSSKEPIVGVEKYNWLYSNAHKYGFITLESDKNVFRYVGVDFATAMYTNSLSFEAFTAKLKEATPQNPVFLNADKTKAAYYCPIENVQVPVNYESSTSGDNVGGIYVTVDFLTPKSAA